MRRKIIAAEIKAEVLAKVKVGEKVAALALQYGVSLNVFIWGVD